MARRKIVISYRIGRFYIPDVDAGRPTEPEVWPNGLPGPDIENGQNPYVITTNATGYTKILLTIYKETDRWISPTHGSRDSNLR